MTTGLGAAPVAARHVARWTAIGCTVHVETRRAADLAPARDVVAQVLRDVDEVASRFRHDSDLSLVNASPGQWVRVDPLLVAAVRVALDAAERTGGLVHPLLGRSLVDLGYDRTFTELDPTVGHPLAGAPGTLGWESAVRRPPALDAWREVEVATDAVRIPADTALDLGATAKAWCTDLAVTALRDHLDLSADAFADTDAAADAEAVVSIGGDLRTCGAQPWEVGVAEHPDAAPEQMTFVELTGALATSSTQVRRWHRDGAALHHLLDPRTGAPAVGPWRTVTVAAPTCVAANTASTAAVVLGAEAVPWLRRHTAAARLVAHDGAVITVGDWPAPARTAPRADGDAR